MGRLQLSPRNRDWGQRIGGPQPASHGPFPKATPESPEPREHPAPRHHPDRAVSPTPPLERFLNRLGKRTLGQFAVTKC